MSKTPIEILSETFDFTVKMHKTHLEGCNTWFELLAEIKVLSLQTQKIYVLNIYEYLYHSNEDLIKIFLELHKDLEAKIKEILDKYTNHPKQILTEKSRETLKGLLTASQKKIAQLEKNRSKYVNYICKLEIVLLAEERNFSQEDWEISMAILVDMNNDLVAFYDYLFSFITQCMRELNDKPI